MPIWTSPGRFQSAGLGQGVSKTGFSRIKPDIKHAFHRLFHYTSPRPVELLLIAVCNSMTNLPQFAQTGRRIFGKRPFDVLALHKKTNMKNFLIAGSVFLGGFLTPDQDI